MMSSSNADNMLASSRGKHRAFKNKSAVFLRRLRSEAGDTVTMFILTAMPFILFTAGWAIDYLKNVAVESDLTDTAQESVSAAIREQQGNGSLQCGQDSNYEDANESTPVLVAYGVDAIQALAEMDYNDSYLSAYTGKPKNTLERIDGINGSSGHYTFSNGSTFNTKKAGSISRLAATYLQKTGRKSLTRNMYENDGNLLLSGGSTAAYDDALFVSTMRSFVGSGTIDKAETNGLKLTPTDDNNFYYSNAAVDATSDDLTENNAIGRPSLNADDSLVLAVTCYRGLSNTDTTDDSKTIGSGNRYTTMSVTVRGWSGNFIIGMFHRDWNIQRYLITARSTTSWSSNAVH